MKYASQMVQNFTSNTDESCLEHSDNLCYPRTSNLLGFSEKNNIGAFEVHSRILVTSHHIYENIDVNYQEIMEYHIGKHDFSK